MQYSLDATFAALILRPTLTLSPYLARSAEVRIRGESEYFFLHGNTSLIIYIVITM